MPIPSLSPAGINTASAGGPLSSRRATTPEQAAEQFEAVLVRQFVQTMTKDLFKASEQEGGMSAMQADAQRDALTTALTDQLSTNDALGLRDMITRRLTRQQLDDAGAQAALDAAANAGPLPLSPPTF